MAGVPRLSTADRLVKDLKRIRKDLVKYAAAFPDEDAYATPYSIISDHIRKIDETVEELKPSIKDAIQHRKEFPDQFPNRARKWCVIHDSRRKPRSGSKDAQSPDEEAS
jgi:hypothetical protein